MKKVLFISHDASRTGAPLLLLWLIDWLKQNKAVQPIVILLKGGALKGEFEAIAETHLWEKQLENTSLLQRVIGKLVNLNSRHQKTIIKRIKKFSPQCLYFNSVVSSGLMPLLKEKIGCPTILHIHEYDIIINQFDMAGGAFTKAKSLTDHFISVSDMVNRNLLINHNVNMDKTTVVYEYIDPSKYRPLPKKSKEKKFIVGGGGFVHWRKGIEFFILVAHHFTKNYPELEAEFWWVGKVNHYDRIYLEQDIQKLSLEKAVYFKGETTDISEVLNAMDIFLITSREDPFPVIAIEAAYHYNPLITWNQAIGTKELIDQGCGSTVDYLDIAGMSDATRAILKDTNSYSELSAKAHELTKEFSIATAGETIHKLIFKQQDANA